MRELKRCETCRLVVKLFNRRHRGAFEPIPVSAMGVAQAPYAI